MDFPQEIVLENAQCRIEFNLPSSAASSCSATVRDKGTGLTLRGGLCEAEVLWNALQRSEVQKDLEVRSAEKRGAQQVVFKFAAGRARTIFEMCVTLEGNEFTVRFPWSGIAEPRGELFRLFGLRPLPKLLSARPGDTFVAPIRTGVLIVPAKHHVNIRDNFLLYGQQWRWEDLPLIPTCGLYAQGKDGVQLIAEEGDCDTQYEIELDGQGGGATGFSCRYRYSWIAPVDPIDRVIRYVLLDAASADYTGMGLRLNRFARETWKMATLEERCRRSPELSFAVRAMLSKTHHGMKDLDHEKGDGQYHLFQTFAETCRQLRKIKDAGVERLYVQLVGWNIDGHDGQYPIRFPIDPRAGGEEGFRELLRYGQSLGYQMQVHDNYADVYQADHPAIVRLLDGEAMGRGVWGGGAAYGINPMKLPADLVKRDMLKLRDLGVKGLYYLDAMSAPLEVDYDPKQGGPRRFHADGLGWVLERGREVFGSAGTECGFAHIVRHSDYIANTPLRNLYSGHVSASPIQEFVDECVPLWHFMFHGMVLHSTGDSGFPSKAKLLEAAETGGGARSDFTGGGNPDPKGTIFCERWDERLLPAYKAKYDILVERLGPNHCAFIRKHRRIGADAFETTFSNGCAVQVDYTEKRLRIDGKDLAIPPVFDLDIGTRR